MTLMTTRETLERLLLRHGHAEWDEFDAKVVADALLASGVVIDAATLADDEDAVTAVRQALWQVRPITAENGRSTAVHALRALAAAVTGAPREGERPVEDPMTFRQATDGAHTRVIPPAERMGL